MSPNRQVPRPRQAVLKLKAYVPPLEGRRDSIRLDFNENTLGFPQELPDFEPDLLTTYPEYDALLSKLSEHFGVSKDWLLLTNGSDEGLFVAAFTFITPDRDRAVVSSPTFALIPHYLQLCQAQITEVPVHEDLSFDLEALEHSFEGARLVMLASPDNPTGGVIPSSLLETWLARYPQTVFVLDEAYGEYHDDTALPLLAENPNLLISRTFSKAWGLAGLRLGLMLGHPQAVEWMARVRSPYSVNSMAVKTLLEFLPHSAKVDSQARAAIEQKKWVIEQLRARGYRVTAGAANFFLIWMEQEATALCQFLKERGLLIRNRSNLPKMAGAVRVSSGSRDQLEKFLNAFDEFREHRRAT